MDSVLSFSPDMKYFGIKISMFEIIMYNELDLQQNISSRRFTWSQASDDESEMENRH